MLQFMGSQRVGAAWRRSSFRSMEGLALSVMGSPRLLYHVEVDALEGLVLVDAVHLHACGGDVPEQLHLLFVPSFEGFVTKGDNNAIDDGAYSAKAENIVGRYVSTLSVMTVMGRIFLSDAGFICTITLFVVIALICYVPDIKEALKNKEKERSGEEDPVKNEIDKLVEAEMERRRREAAAKASSPEISDDSSKTPVGSSDRADRK